MGREGKVGLGPMRSSKRFIIYFFARLAIPLGLISAILSIVGHEPALLVVLGLWLLLTIVVFTLMFRKRVLQFDKYHAHWAAIGLGIGFAAGFAGFFGVIYALHYASEWFILAAIAVTVFYFTWSFMEIRHEWPRTSSPAKRFLRNLVMVNIPTSAFLISYLFIFFPRNNNFLSLLIAVLVYIVPNGIIFAKRFKELMSSRSPSSGEPKDRKIV